MTMLSTVLVAGVIAAPAAGAEAPDLTGAWEGRLNVAGQSIRIVFRIDGTGAVMDSPDQGGFDIPAEGPTVEGGVVRLGVAAIGGSFEGALSADGRTLTGTLRQGGVAAPLVLTRQAAAHSAAPDPAAIARLVGTWEGSLTVSGQTLKLVFRVGEDGRAVMDSPDQGARGIGAGRPTLSGDEVTFTIAAANARMVGELSADGATLSGTFFQGTMEAPLVLTRTAAGAEAEAARPQTPQPPFPYRSEEVAFDNPAASGVTLAGTLTLPEGPGPFPAAILITGSGPQDRDETIEGHKPFAIWADELTRRGVAVLRFDDRGVAGSTGEFGAATSADFATDVRAVFDGLAARPDIDPARIGLIGHSEGATVAYLAMAGGLRPAWLVTLAGGAVSGGDIITEQVRLLSEVTGATPEAVEAAVATQRRLMDAVADNAADGEAAQRAAETILVEAGTPQGAATRSAAAMAHPWFRGFVAYDPGPSIAAIEAPMLAVFGQKDLQVPPDQNAPVLRQLKPDAEVVVLPGLNHLFQPAGTGLPSEYGQIETSLDPSVISTVVDWVVARAGL